MVKVILGSALGGLVAGGIALMAGGQMRATTAEANMPFAPGASAMTVAQTAAMPAVQCAPHQEATMQRVIVNGQEAAALACVDRAAGMVYYQPAGYAPQPYAQPAAYAPMAQPAVQTRTAPARERVVYREPDVRQQPKRSIAKTAMIIGGSAGTGAGIGAIAGGKKGALIGAAIGGGAASIWEATKR
jgi:hypothetical protein